MSSEKKVRQWHPDVVRALDLIMDIESHQDEPGLTLEDDIDRRVGVKQDLQKYLDAGDWDKFRYVPQNHDCFLETTPRWSRFVTELQGAAELAQLKRHAEDYQREYHTLFGAYELAVPPSELPARELVLDFCQRYNSLFTIPLSQRDLDAEQLRERVWVVARELHERMSHIS